MLYCPLVTLRSILNSVLKTIIEFLLSLNLKTPCLLSCAQILYKFSCRSCQGSYIGSTTKQSRIRFFQHLGKSPRTNRPVTVPAHSTPRNHCHENDHLLSLNDFKIIDSTNNEHELRISESLYICKEKPSLNIDQSATPLSLF